MNQLKIILQSKWLFLLLFSLTLTFIIIKTKIISYQSIYNITDNKFIGTVEKINKNNIILKAKEKLIIKTDNFSYQLGDKIEVIGNLSIPTNNTIPNTFNYQEYLYNQKIYYVVKPNNIKLISKNNNFIYKIKSFLEKYFNNFKSKDILNALLLGNLSSIDNDLYSSYQENGISHLFSISGIHISFIILILSKLKKKKNILYDFFLLFLIYFIFLLTNKSIPVLRILIFQILSILNKRLKLNLETIHLFLYSLIIPLFINPFYIYQKGFLYSYLISFILIINKEYLTGNYFIKILKISTISFLFSIPLNIYYNYSINILSIIYNIIYVPIFTILILPLVFLTPIIPILDYPLFYITDILNKLSIFLSNISIVTIILKKINIYILIIYYIIFYFIIKLILNRNKKGLIILFLIIFIHANINYFIKDKYYMMIDVSQGDSSLLYINNQTLLIDTGGLYNKDISKDIITMLKSFGINKIDILLITHGDFDHMGESINLVNNFKVNKVILNNNSFNDLENNLINVLKKKKIPYYNNLDYFYLDNNKINILNTRLYDNENDNSNVLYFELNKYKFLIMGDAGIEKEKDILKKYNLSNIDILKVGHHGSNTSSSKEFIKEINPKYSLISVGKYNKYGHPNKEVLNNLNNSKIYRTDQDGSIMFKIKNNKSKIETCSP